MESLTRQAASWTALPLVQGGSQGSTMERAYLFEEDAPEDASHKQVECQHSRPVMVGSVSLALVLKRAMVLLGSVEMADLSSIPVFQRYRDGASFSFVPCRSIFVI